MANKKIRQEFNLTNVTADPINSLESGFGFGGVAEVDLDDFNNYTAYFEIIAKNSAGSGLVIQLKRDSTGIRTSGSTIKSYTVPGNTNSWTRFRSSSFSLSSTDVYYFYNSISDTSISIRSAKIIILQDAAEITDTQTQIEIGAYQAVGSVASAGTYYEISEPKIWKYESAKFDPTPTFTLGFTAINENDMDTSTIALQQADDAAFTTNVTEITNSITDFTDDTNITYYESSSFSLSDGKYYRMVYTNDGTMYGLTFYNAKIIATQTDAGGIAALQNEYLLINEGQTGTGVQEYFTLYDANEWDDGSGNPPDLYHEHSASASGSNTKLYDSSGDITDSSITGANLQRSSALTLTDDEEIDANIVTA